MVLYFHQALSVNILLIKPFIIVNNFFIIFKIITKPIRLCIVPITWASLPNAKILRAHPIEYVLRVYLWVRISNSCHWLELFLFVNLKWNWIGNSIRFFGKINLIQVEWASNYSIEVNFSSCLVWYALIHNKVYYYRDWIFANVKSPHLVDYIKLRDVLALKYFLDEIVHNIVLFNVLLLLILKVFIAFYTTGIIWLAKNILKSNIIYWFKSEVIYL